MHNMYFHLIELVAGFTCLLLFVFLFRREPRRISCALLLLLSIYWIVTGALRLLLPSTYFPDGSMQMGEGEDILFVIQLLFLFISFFGGIALCFNGIKVMRREGRSLAHALPILFGIMGVCYPFLYFAALVFVGNALLFMIQGEIWIVILYIPAMLAAVFLYSIVYALIPKSAAVDYIIVLGAGLQGGNTVSPLLANRLKRAIDLYERGGKHAKFVVSGGKGDDQQVSEAHAMREYLLSQDIPTEKILTENQSRNTAENIRFSQQVMRKDFEAVRHESNEESAGFNYRSAIVTSNFHVLRAVIIAKNCGLDAQGVGGKTAFYYLPAAFIREYIAVIFGYRRLALAYIAVILVYSNLSFLF